MFICASGDIHGALNRLYADVLAFECELGARFDHVLHVGDFGIWPDPERVDKATRKHEGAGDFPAWLAEGREAPRSTIFIKGNHEDFAWLDERCDDYALPGLRYLRNGTVIEIEGPDFFGHHHRSVDAKVAGIRCIGLNIVGRPGNLVAIDVPARGRGWTVCGKWPPAQAPHN